MSRQGGRLGNLSYQTEIQQMMFVFGEVAEPLEETTQLVEEIVREQTIQFMIAAIQQSQRRGSRFVTAEDLMFLIRQDPQKVHRLKLFLSWKDVRKDARKGGKADDDIQEDVDEVDDHNIQGKSKKKIKFSWDLLGYYGSVLEEEDDEDDDDDDARQASEDQQQRLKHADDITKTMTKEEYMYYSECRQASFTFKKQAKFRKWCEMGTYYDTKPREEVLDILGYFSYEAVSALTETGLKIKANWEAKTSKEREESSESKNIGIFSRPRTEQTPLHPMHIHEAYRLLQRTNKHFFQNFTGGVYRYKPIFI